MRWIVRGGLLAFSLVAAARPLTAAAGDDRPDCGHATTQIEMNACAELEFEEADKALNALWPKFVADARERDADQGKEMKALGVPTTLAALREAQHAWIAFRDAECSYESYAAFGGTMQPMLGSLCKARMTKSRIEELKAALSQQ